MPGAEGRRTARRLAASNRSGRAAGATDRPFADPVPPARAIALRTAPGRVEKAEREREGGGMRYSFDIRQGNRIHEIGVDVVTGRIVEDKFEALNARD